MHNRMKDTVRPLTECKNRIQNRI